MTDPAKLQAQAAGDIAKLQAQAAEDLAKLQAQAAEDPSNEDEADFEDTAEIPPGEDDNPLANAKPAAKATLDSEPPPKKLKGASPPLPPHFQRPPVLAPSLIGVTRQGGHIYNYCAHFLAQLGEQQPQPYDMC